MTVPVAPDATQDLSSALSAAVSAVLDSPEAVAPDEGPEDPNQLVLNAEAADPDATDDDEAPADDAPEGEDPSEAEAVTLPEGFVVVEPVAEGLATEFTLRDAAGDELEVPALMIEYKANGKVRRDRLDQVVKLAQFGVYNQDREARVASVEEEARLVAQQREEIAEMLAEREAQLERLLTDDAFYLKVQEEYQAENTPESRAKRAEQELVALQAERELQQISAVGQAFMDRELEPALRLIEQALPSVSRDELDERLTVAMQAHLVRGPGGVPYLPESRYAVMRKYIVEDLARWAQMVHMERSERQRDPEKERLAAERDKARIESQKAKRQMGQALKPVTRGVATAGNRPKAKPISTLDDAVSSALSTVLNSI
jgi:hypothetical protein